MSEQVEFRHLKYIVAVAEAGNFTRAAERLFLSQPSLSKQIKDIENEIGVQIFERHRDGVYTTPIGQMVVDYAVATLCGRTHVFKLAKEIFSGAIPPLRVGFSCFVNSRHLQTFRSLYQGTLPSYAQVVETSPKDNLITVRKQDGVHATYDPSRLRGISAYREIEREFAIGDRVQLTAPNRDLQVANRDLGTLREISPEGRLTLRMDSGREVSFDPHEMRHFDHGYAVTSHSSQGLTSERVLVNMDSNVHPELINGRFAYVSVSRASHDAQVFTNDAANLAENLSRDVSKTSALDFDKSLSRVQNALQDHLKIDSARPSTGLSLGL